MNYTYTLATTDILNENNLCSFTLHNFKECCLVVFSGARVKADLNIFVCVTMHLLVMSHCSYYHHCIFIAIITVDLTYECICIVQVPIYICLLTMTH